MKEENQNVKEREIAEDQIDFRALLFKYIIHWQIGRASCRERV